VSPTQIPRLCTGSQRATSCATRVVHEGAQSTMATALEAARAGEALSARLDDALVDAVARYPRTAARKLGLALLDRVPEDAAVAALVAEEAVSPLKVGVVQEG